MGWSDRNQTPPKRLACCRRRLDSGSQKKGRVGTTWSFSFLGMDASTNIQHVLACNCSLGLIQKRPFVNMKVSWNCCSNRNLWFWGAAFVFTEKVAYVGCRESIHVEVKKESKDFLHLHDWACTTGRSNFCAVFLCRNWATVYFFHWKWEWISIYLTTMKISSLPNLFESNSWNSQLSPRWEKQF